MPAPITTALLVLGAVLTCISPLAGCIVAGLGVLWQILVSVVQATSGTSSGGEL
jgi:hypothetical protein